jgi:WD40 repeat protein
VNDVDFSADGRFLATTSDDRSVVLWSTRGFTPRLVLTTDSQAIAAVFSPDGKTLAVGDAHVVRLYPVDLTSLERDPAVVLGEAEAALGARLDGFELRTIGVSNNAPSR